MKVLVIGATGHIGSYLVKGLLEKGHEVYAVSRGGRNPYGVSDIWEKAHMVSASRVELCQNDWIEQIAPDAVCDLIAYSVDDVKNILTKIPKNAFYLLVGSIWAYQEKLYVPVDEKHPKNATGNYGKQKGLMEDYLLRLCKSEGLKGCVVHPGHISGKEWTPINPQGNVNREIYEKIARGEEILLPNDGLATLQHIHSFDLANILIACLEKQDVSRGQAFIAVAERAESLKEMSENLFRRYGYEPKIAYVSWAEFENSVSKDDFEATFEHASYSPNCSVEKAKKLLGVRLQYTIDDILNEYMDYQNIAKAPSLD